MSEEERKFSEIVDAVFSDFVHSVVGSADLSFDQDYHWEEWKCHIHDENPGIWKCLYLFCSDICLSWFWISEELRKFPWMKHWRMWRSFEKSNQDGRYCIWQQTKNQRNAHKQFVSFFTHFYSPLTPFLFLIINEVFSSLRDISLD